MYLALSLAARLQPNTQLHAKQLYQHLLQCFSNHSFQPYIYEYRNVLNGLRWLMAASYEVVHLRNSSRRAVCYQELNRSLLMTLMSSRHGGCRLQHRFRVDTSNSSQLYTSALLSKNLHL